MAVANRHILQQGAVLASLARTAVRGLRHRSVPPTSPALPGPEVSRAQPALPRELIRAYVAHLGSDPRAYRGRVPAHLFPQWCFPALARTLEQAPYPLLRVVNGGCRLEVREPIPDSEELVVAACLQSIDDDGRRAVLHQRALAGTVSRPEALAIDVYAIVPLSKKRVVAEKNDGAGRQVRVRVPDEARELLRKRLTEQHALSYAKLTGDFNPIHWLAPYARASGFSNVILHGFASLAHSWEGLTRSRFSGDVDALSCIDVKFTRPLVLPREVGLYLRGNEIALGDARGAPPYLSGRFDVRHRKRGEIP